MNCQNTVLLSAETRTANSQSDWRIFIATFLTVLTTVHEVKGKKVNNDILRL